MSGRPVILRMPRRTPALYLWALRARLRGRKAPVMDQEPLTGDEAARALYRAWAAEKSPLAVSWVLLDRGERARWRRIASAAPAPRFRATAELRRFARDGQWLTCTGDGHLDMRTELLAVKRAVRGALAPSPWERLWRS